MQFRAYSHLWLAKHQHNCKRSISNLNSSQRYLYFYSCAVSCSIPFQEINYKQIGTNPTTCDSVTLPQLMESVREEDIQGMKVEISSVCVWLSCGAKNNKGVNWGSFSFNVDWCNLVLDKKVFVHQGSTTKARRNCRLLSFLEGIWILSRKNQRSCKLLLREPRTSTWHKCHCSNKMTLLAVLHVITPSSAF